MRSVLLASAALWFAAASSGAAAPTPRQLVELADLTGPALSPDGRFIAFRLDQASVERNAYESAWYVEPIDQAAPPKKVGDGGAPLFSDAGTALAETPRWSPDGTWIYYRARLDDQLQVWRAKADGSGSEPVTSDDADVERFALSADGRTLFYEVGATRAALAAAEQAEYDQGIRIDSSVPVGEGLYHSGFINGRRATVRLTGRWAQRADLLWNAEQRWKAVDLIGQAGQTAHEADAGALAQALAAAPSSGLGPPLALPPWAGARVTVIDKGASAELEAAPARSDGTPLRCQALGCRGSPIAWAVWRPGGAQVVFVSTDYDRGRAQSVKVWDLASGAVRTVLQAPGLLGGGRQIGEHEPCAVGAAFAVCVSASASGPPSLVRIDLATGAVTTLFAPNADLATTGIPVQLLRWRDAAGHRFTGQFFAPAAAAGPRPAPLFITYYTCTGYLRGGLGDEWPLASLAGAGIAALCINEPPVDPEHLDQLARYRLALSGVRAIVGQLSRRGLIDAKHVGMGGLSFGSEVTLWTAMRSHLLAAASVSSSAVTPTYYAFHSLEGDAFTGPLRKIWGLNSPAETPVRWRLISPAFNIERIRTPILMQMPEREYLEAIDYFAPLSRSTTPTELYVFPDEPHMKVQPRHKLAVYQRNLDWFRFWLQGYVDPDPLEAGQYQRWTALRAKYAVGLGAAPARGNSNPSLHPVRPARRTSPHLELHPTKGITR